MDPGRPGEVDHDAGPASIELTIAKRHDQSGALRSRGCRQIEIEIRDIDNCAVGCIEREDVGGDLPGHLEPDGGATIVPGELDRGGAGPRAGGRARFHGCRPGAAALGLGNDGRWCRRALGARGGGRDDRAETQRHDTAQRLPRCASLLGSGPPKPTLPECCRHLVATPSAGKRTWHLQSGTAAPRCGSLYHENSTNSGRTLTGCLHDT